MFSSSLPFSSSAQRLSIFSPTSPASEVTSLPVPSPIGVEISASFRLGCEEPSLSNFVSAAANSASEVTRLGRSVAAKTVWKKSGLRSPLPNAVTAFETASRRSGEVRESGGSFCRIILRAGYGGGSGVCCGTRGSFGRRGCCWKYKESSLRRMELFAPQLMDTASFRFLSEYHTTPALRAVHDSVSPLCFFGFGQAKAPVVEVVQAGDPVLHEPCEEVRVEDIGSARVERIINDMVATMRNAPGVGLAAPQVGVPLQIIVLEDTKELMSHVSAEECEVQQRYPFDLLVIINPKLKTKSNSGSAIFFEGCLSVDGYRALVKRDLEVEVAGLGRDGKPIRVQAIGWKARILQHECDHLVGELYVDKMIPRTYRTKDNLRLPLPAGCPEQGVCNH